MHEMPSDLENWKTIEKQHRDGESWDEFFNKDKYHMESCVEFTRYEMITRIESQQGKGNRRVEYGIERKKDNSNSSLLQIPTTLIL
jgi:hypothetical protein